MVHAMDVGEAAAVAQSETVQASFIHVVDVDHKISKTVYGKEVLRK